MHSFAGYTERVLQDGTKRRHTTTKPCGLRSARPAQRSRQRDAFDIGVSAYQGEDMRTTVTLDDDVYHAAAHLSRASGERLGKVLSSLARRGLAPATAPSKRSSRRFPTFDVPADAPVIPASRVQRVIDEDGIS